MSYCNSSNSLLDKFSNIGTGNFGQWGNDENGNPCFYLKTESVVNQDVWHLVGNDRITATVHGQGYVQIYAWDRGPQLLNRYEPEKGLYAGGYSLIIIEGNQLITLLGETCKDSAYRIIWGYGYAKKIIHNPLLYIEEIIYAPEGNDPVIIHNLKVRNISSEQQRLFIIPVWEPNWYPIDPGLIMTPPYDKFWNWLRKRRGKKIRNKATIVASGDTLFLRYPATEQVGKRTSWKVMPVDGFFMTSLNTCESEQCFAKRDELEKFLNTAIKNYTKQKLKVNSNPIFAFLYKGKLEPDGEISLRYLVGYGPAEKIPDYKAKYYSENPPNHKKQIYADIPDITVPVTRELKWHSYYLQAGSIYSEYFNRYFVDQGSAYGYIHGASGAPRDWAFFSVPLTYLRPDLAREMLLFLCQLQNRKTGKLPYTLAGNGKATGAGVHSWSSDLDLFFLYAFSEYLGATFDTAILEEEVPFRDMDFSYKANVLEHIKKSFLHLTESIGTGKHGLIRCGTGDWNDAFLAFSSFPPLTMLRGESVLNSALAVLVLPEIAQWIASYDSQLAESMKNFAQQQKQALQSLWNGKWFPRGYVGIGNKRLGDNHIFLDVQPFTILANVLNEEQKQILLRAIKEKCVDTQPFGATCLVPPMKGRFLEPGSDTNGGSWYAINAWLTWAWGQCNPQEAWNFFLKNTLFTHADAYPHIWYGIWSGPDAYNSAEHPRAGETFCLNFTPMTQFPVMNMNCHAGILYSALKLFGLCPRDKILYIDPKVPFEKFTLKTPLISCSYQPDRVKVQYNPVCSGEITLSIKLPPLLRIKPDSLKITLNDNPYYYFQNTPNNYIMFTAKIQNHTPLTLDIHKKTES